MRAGIVVVNEWGGLDGQGEWGGVWSGGVGWVGYVGGGWLGGVVVRACCAAFFWRREKWYPYLPHQGLVGICGFLEDLGWVGFL